MTTRRGRTRSQGGEALPSETVALARRTPPTHAKGMRDLVGMTIGVRQGEPFSAMRLDFELSCGTAAMRVNGADFVVSLRTCHVALDLDGCEILPHSPYEHRLTPGSLEATSSESRALGSLRGISAGIEVSASASDSAKPGLLAKVFGKATRSRQSETSNRETLKRQERVDLVSTAGQDRWQVGDPRYGDGRKPGGRLSGSYFGEERDDEGEPKPMCVVAGGPSGTAVITASALVRFGQILVTLGSEEASPAEREDLDAELTARGRQVQAAHRRRERDLRARMAGLVLAKALHEADRDGPAAREGEVLMARQSIALASRGAMRDEADEP